jgi:hypothetical protein
MDKDKSFLFDPRVFISGPLLECPKCHKPGSFGTNWISGGHFTRKCKECLYSKSYKLPKLNKKVIYLDQFVISLMMKAINEKLGKTKTTPSFWLTLFEKIDRLLKLQLIICPDSTFHEEESALYQFEAQKRMYEHLSNGSTFYDPGTIRGFQISDYFRQMTKGVERPESNLERSQVIRGHYNDWQERIRISVNFDIKAEELEQLKATKIKINQGLAQLFEAWKKEKDKSYKDRFAEEVMAYGQAIVEQYFNNLSKIYFVSKGKLPATAEEYLNLIRSNANTIIKSLQSYLPETKDPDKKKANFKKVVDFLLSEKMADIPLNRLTALLWSALADQFAHGGRTNNPGDGIASDISMVSSILPYCDAMFIDKEMHGLLKHPEVAKAVKRKYKTEIYSTANKQEFMDYLDSIESAASKAHLQKVKEVYGENWPKPFTEMYNYEK